MRLSCTSTMAVSYTHLRPLCIGILLLTVYLIYANIKALKRGKEVQQDSKIQQELQEE